MKINDENLRNLKEQMKLDFETKISIIILNDIQLINTLIERCNALKKI